MDKEYRAELHAIIDELDNYTLRLVLSFVKRLLSWQAEYK